MHPAFQVDEILRFILAPFCDRKQRCNLLQVALSCKSFKDTALDLLWGLPLTYKEVLYPFIAWGILSERLDWNDFMEQMETVLISNRPCSSSDWNMYKPYAQRVRSIQWDLKSSSQLWDETVDSLAQGVHPPIFPSILEFQAIFHRLNEVNQFSVLMLSPSLRRISVHSTDHRLDITGLLNDITDTAINLEHLTFNTMHVDEPCPGRLEASIRKIISSSGGLKELSAVIPITVLNMMKNEPLKSRSLTSLTLTTEGIIREHVGYLPILDCPLLESLDIYSANSRCYTDQGFPGAQMDRLKRFHVTTEAPLHGEDIVLPFFNIAIRCGSSTIESLSLRSNQGPPLRPFATDLPIIYMRHLHLLTSSPLADLVSIQIVGKVHPDLTNDDLLLIGRSNPRLQRLYIGPISNNWPSEGQLLPSRIDTQGLISFAYSVPNLLKLRLSIRAIPTAVEAKTDSPGVIPKLRKWDIYMSSIEEPEEVASLLIKYLPNLEHVIMHQVMVYWPSFHPVVQQQNHRPLMIEFQRRLIGFRKVYDMVREASKLRRYPECNSGET